MCDILTEVCSPLGVEPKDPNPPFAPDFDSQMQVILDLGVPIFSFTFGVLSSFRIQKLKEKGVVLIGTATSLAEGIELEKQGIDIIVGQGAEAGGHRGTYIGKEEDSLIPTKDLALQLVSNLSTPVVASGDIMDKASVSDYLDNGVAAVQMGTAFLSTKESGANPTYKARLINSGDKYSNTTTLTRAFSGKMARGIVNEFTEKMQAHTNSILDYPIQNALTSAFRKEAVKQNNPEYMSLWAGEGVDACRDVSASELIHSLF